MSEAYVTLNPGTDEEVTLSISQVLKLNELMKEFADPIWHPNKCGCCVSLHERGDSSKGYVVGSDGGADLVTARSDRFALEDDCDADD